MAYKDILVHLDRLEGSKERLAVALRLAQAQGARLTGLLVIRHGYPGEAVVEAVRALFGRSLEGAGIEGRWECVDGSVLGEGMTDLLIRLGHHSDLLVVGQGSGASASVGVPADLPERAVLESGRPVLVVPYAGAFPAVGERILVAWKAGRECTRAVNDALPLLQRAQRVDLFARVEPGSPGSGPEGLCAEVRAHLARHGVAARAHALVVEELPVPDALLNRVCDEGFDLLVMGAYAHGPEGRPALGSVARRLLRQMTVPILMSH